MAALIEAINVKRKTLFELENIPYACLDSDISTPTARGGQTLVRLKMRNLLTSAVFEKTFKANDKFKEPDLQLVPASYLYSDSQGSHFLDQESYETLTLAEQVMGDALDLLIEGTLIQIHMYNGNPIGLELPTFVELAVAFTEPGVRGDVVEQPADLLVGEPHFAVVGLLVLLVVQPGENPLSLVKLELAFRLLDHRAVRVRIDLEE